MRRFSRGIWLGIFPTAAATTPSNHETTAAETTMAPHTATATHSQLSIQRRSRLSNCLCGCNVLGAAAINYVARDPREEYFRVWLSAPLPSWPASPFHSSARLRLRADRRLRIVGFELPS
eukprot:scaffold117546_cov33-Cyclotella_meneghiniana.AAC.1